MRYLSSLEQEKQTSPVVASAATALSGPSRTGGCRDSGQAEPKMVDFENQRGAYFCT